MTKSEIIKILTFLKGCYGHKFKYPRDSTIKTADLEEKWFSFLHNFNSVEARIAVKRACLQKPEWPPTPAEVASEIFRLLNPRAENLSGLKAWQLVLSAINRYGTYQAGEALRSLPDQVCEALDNIGGFDRVALSNNQDSYLYHRFLKAYEELSDKKLQAALLPAACEADNPAGYLAAIEEGDV